MAQQQQRHPIFGDIVDGNLEEVQRRVRADAAVLEEREEELRMTPLIWAIFRQQLAIALWLIEHRGQHDLESRERGGQTAFHWACWRGPLSVMKALVGAGANPTALDRDGWTPLMRAAAYDHANIAAFLLQQPVVKATIDVITSDRMWTSLSSTSCDGHLDIVQLLLDAGADPTIPAGQLSPLNSATEYGHQDVAALLRTAIAEPDRARALHKARALLDAAHEIRHVRLGNDIDRDDKGSEQQQQQQPRPRRVRTRGETQRRAVAAAPAYLKERVEREAALPQVDITPQQGRGRMGGEDEQRLRATAAFALEGLPRELYVELLRFMLPRWAGKGPEA